MKKWYVSWNSEAFLIQYALANPNVRPKKIFLLKVRTNLDCRFITMEV